MKEEQVKVLTEEFVRDFVEQWKVAWESGDANQVVSLCTDDVVIKDPAAPETLYGRGAVGELTGALFKAFPKMQFEILGGPYLSFDGTKAAVHFRVMCTMLGPLHPPGFAPTGQRVEFEAVDLYEFREGLLSKYTIVYDMLNLGRQIGAAPKPGTLGERIGVFMQRMTAWRMRRRAGR
jgi:predicted ester cyclase